MKKRLTAKPRLTVQREVVRQLTEKELPRVGGGDADPEPRTTTSLYCPLDEAVE